MNRPANIFIFVCLVSINALSIEKVSDKNNVTKRETGDFYPDWVPFRNKQGEELGEFIPVPKAKPKKRLAPPVNFILRAVAEPEGDDYYDKGQGESDSDDYYEKKEWSDLNRPMNTVDADRPIKHTELSEIDGVVDIITKSKPSLVLSAIKNSAKKNIKKVDTSGESSDENRSVEKAAKVEESDSKENINQDVKPEKKYEDDVEYEESNADTKKPDPTDDEQRENEAKKARILSSVDELKERHAEEQRAISEKVKEEEIFKEEFERNNNIGRVEEGGKYDRHIINKKDDYDEYDDKDVAVHEKYKPHPGKSSTTTKKPKKNINKKEEVGKLSVFKNPHLYVVYDDESEELITTKAPRTKSKGSSKFSPQADISTTPEENDNVRISLVPQSADTKEGEPTLFFPRTRKNKRRRKNKTTTVAPDSYVAETVEDAASKGLTTGADFTSTDSTAVGSGPSGEETGPSATALQPSAADTTSFGAVTDAVPASSNHKKEHEKEKKHEDHHKEKDASPPQPIYVPLLGTGPPHGETHEDYGPKHHHAGPMRVGGGREFRSEHSEKHEEHGKKAYQGEHADTKTAKGHHDKESHHGKYEDHGGHDKHHDESSSHHADHNHEEHGKKQAKYEESGKHSKGHSTKGSHDIHKKEEYEKKVEFFEEDGDSAEEEKHGGFHDEKQHKKGGHFKNADYKAGHHQHKKGDSGHYHKGGHGLGYKSHSVGDGHESHGKHGHNHFDKKEKESGKKWIYHHGHPAKTANLVIIDRRTDQLYHGPQYYG